MFFWLTAPSVQSNYRTTQNLILNDFDCRMPSVRRNRPVSARNCQNPTSVFAFRFCANSCKNPRVSPGETYKFRDAASGVSLLVPEVPAFVFSSLLRCSQSKTFINSLYCLYLPFSPFPYPADINFIPRSWQPIHRNLLS